jgi:hypothetical protein
MLTGNGSESLANRAYGETAVVAPRQGQMSTVKRLPPRRVSSLDVRKNIFRNVKKRIIQQLIELPVSRQRKWQLRQKQRGLCQKCSKPAAPGSVNCVEHMVDHRVAARNRYEPKRGRTHQYRTTKSYRLAAAIQGDLRLLRPRDVQELLNSRCHEHRELARRAVSERPELRPYARWAA